MPAFLSVPTTTQITSFFSQLGKDIYDTSVTLFKIMIPAIIIVKIAQELGGIDLLASFIEPLMNGLGLPENVGLVWAMTIATNLYGGLIINEAKRGEIPARDVFSTIILLGLLHSLIEDTILIMLLGADFTSIFWGRLIFVTLFVGVFLRLVGLMSEETRQRYFYRSIS